MLSQLGSEDEERVRFGVKAPDAEQERVMKEEQKVQKGYEGVDWESMVSGTKKVLTMDVGCSCFVKTGAEIVLIPRLRRTWHS